MAITVPEGKAAIKISRILAEQVPVAMELTSI